MERVGGVFIQSNARQKDERMDAERQDDDDMPQVCVARHKMKV